MGGSTGNRTPDLGTMFKLPNPNLQSWLTRTVAGYPEDIRTPMWGKAPRAQVLATWDKVIQSDASKRLMPPGLLEYELEMRAKVGPYSIVRPLKERMPDVNSYYTSPVDQGVSVPQAAIDCVLDEYSVLKVRPKTVTNTVADMRKSTSSGAPFVVKKRNCVQETVDQLQIDGSVGQFEPVALLAARSQEGGPEVKDVKNRVVWAFPFGVNIRELQMLQPLIKAIQAKNVIPAYTSMDAVDKSISDMFAAKGKRDLVISTDFEHYDQSINKRLQRVDRSVLEEVLVPSDATQEWFDNVFHWAYDIPLVCCPTIMKVGSHGLASGAGRTNSAGCNIHRALQYAAALKAGAELNPYSQVLSDDGLITFPGITVKKVTSVYTQYGLTMNESKQYADLHSCVYLRRFHSDQYVVDGVMAGIYPTYRALGRLLGQERYYDPDSWNEKMVVLRTWSIIENTNKHPLFEKFVDFCIKGDKYRLGLSIPGFMDDVGHIAQEAVDMMPDFLGYTKTLQAGEKGVAKGITNWRIYQYLSSQSKR